MLARAVMSLATIKARRTLAEVQHILPRDTSLTDGASALAALQLAMAMQHLVDPRAKFQQQPQHPPALGA